MSGFYFLFFFFLTACQRPARAATYIFDRKNVKLKGKAGEVKGWPWFLWRFRGPKEGRKEKGGTGKKRGLLIVKRRLATFIFARVFVFDDPDVLDAAELFERLAEVILLEALVTDDEEPRVRRVIVLRARIKLRVKRVSVSVVGHFATVDRHRTRKHVFVTGVALPVVSVTYLLFKITTPTNVNKKNFN